MRALPRAVIYSFLATAVIVLGIVALVYFEPQETVSLDDPANEAVRTQLRILMSDAHLTFPEQVGQTAITLAELDPTLALFVQDVEAASVDRAVYEDGRSGYRIVHQYWPDLQEAHDKILMSAQRVGWAMLSSSRSEYADHMEFRNHLYDVRIIGQLLQDELQPTYYIQVISAR